MGTENYAVFHQVSEGNWEQLTSWITLLAAYAMIKAEAYPYENQQVFKKIT